MQSSRRFNDRFFTFPDNFNRTLCAFNYVIIILLATTNLYSGTVCFYKIHIENKIIILLEILKYLNT